MTFSVFKAENHDAQADDTAIATVSIGAASATQAASGSRATLKKNRLNGYSSLLFDGANDYYDFGDVFDLGAKSLTIFFVGKRDVGGAICGKTTGLLSANSGQWACLSQGSGDYTWFKNNVNQYAEQLNTYAADTDFHIYEFHIDRIAGVIKFIRDGVALYSKVIAPIPDADNLNTSHNFTLGTGFYNAPTTFGTFAGEIIDFQIQVDDPLSSAQITAKRDELNQKYFAPADVTNLTVDANLNINSDAATGTPAVTSYQTQRRINGGAWFTLTPTAKSFHDTENLPSASGTFTLEFRRKAYNGVYSKNWSEIFTVEYEVPSALDEYFERFLLSDIFNITRLELEMPVLSADFGNGYGVGALSGKPSGLRYWTIGAEVLPDLEEYSVDYKVDDDDLTDSRFEYFWEFYRRHMALGNKPFYFVDPRTNRKFLASFIDIRISFEALTAKLYGGGLPIKQRRVKNNAINFRAEDGSVSN